MKTFVKSTLGLAVLLSATLVTRATILVNDTWLDGERATPASPTYSENGTDADADLDLECAWFKGGSGTMGAAAGHLTVAGLGSSSFWTTFFTPEASPVTLAASGDKLILTWVFSATGINAVNTSQGFNVALVDTPAASRIAADASPSATTAYTGYAMFMNMGQTLGGTPFQLKEFLTGTGNGNLLGTSGNWGADGAAGNFGNGATSGNAGYVNGTSYTFQMTLTRNAAAGLDIVATMSGGTLNGTGLCTLTTNDATPNSFTFDTFAVRPSSSALSATDFDFTLFKVEFVSGGGCAPAGVTTSPVNQTVYETFRPTFSVVASGSSPTYQWQATNYTGSFTNISGATNNTYTTPPLTLADNGKAYRCAITVSCGGGSTANSAAAVVTVNPLPTFSGVVVNDTWQDNTSNDPVPPLFSEIGTDSDADNDLESAWFSGGNSVATPGISNNVSGELTLYPQAANSRTWLTHFTTNGVIHLNDGEMVRATFIFRPVTITDNTLASLRFGLFNYTASGANRMVTNISSANTQGDNVQGYAAEVNFSTVFHTNAGAPLIMRTRTVTSAANLMGDTASYSSNLNTNSYTDGTPGFVDGVTYTNELTVAKYAGNLVRFGLKMTGPGGALLNQTVNDTTGTNWVNFDTFAVRAATSGATAVELGVKRFKVEKTTAPAIAPTPIPVAIAQASGNVILTWSNPAFVLQSSTNVASGYTTIAGATSPYTNAPTGVKKFFRLISP